MDLKQGTVTIAQIARQPGAMELLHRLAPGLEHHSMAPLVQSWTVRQAAAFARQQGATQEQIMEVIRQIEAL